MSWLDPILGWTLAMHPFLSILILSFIVTMISNLIYKYTTDQAEMKRLKTQIEGFRKEIKASRDNPKKMMKINNEAMSVNMQYMTKSLKPMLFTFIPVIVIFAWMSANFTYAAMAPDQPLVVRAYAVEGFAGTISMHSSTLTTKDLASPIAKDTTLGSVASFAIQGPAGIHNLSFSYENKTYDGNTALVWLGENPVQQSFPGKGPISRIDVDYPKIHPLGDFHIFSWYPGWIFLYIVLSIILSMSSRKLLQIY